MSELASTGYGMYEEVEVVNNLNKVKGFDPRKYMRLISNEGQQSKYYLDVAFRKLWFTENKAHGFEVQDIRLGGLKQRLAHCRSRLTEYAEGKIENIPELEEGVLDYFGNGKEYSEETGAACLSWWRSALVQLM